MVFEFFLLFGAGILAGIINAVAGGGSFVAFPALLLVGVPPIIANATNTFAALPGYVSGAIGYWPHIWEERKRLPLYLAATLLGGVIGADLLLRISEEAFDKALPWLMLLAVLLFAYGSALNQIVSRWAKVALGARNNGIIGAVLILALLILVNIYGGFFNGGLGIILLAFFAVAGLTNIHAMNGLKLALSSVVALVATVRFAAVGSIAWLEGGFVFVGTLIGGFLAAKIAQKIPLNLLRRGIVLYGFTLVVIFFVQAYFVS